MRKRKKFKAYVSALMIVLILFGYMPLSNVSVNTVYAASTGHDWANMSNQEFVRLIMKSTASGRPYSNPDFAARWKEYQTIKFTDDTYPWNAATYEEAKYLLDSKKVDIDACKNDPDFRLLYDQYLGIYNPANKAKDWVNMSDQEFVREMMISLPSSSSLMNPDLSARWNAYQKTTFDNTYPWKTASYEEVKFLVESNKVNIDVCYDNNAYFRVLYDRYQAAEEKEKNEQIWEDSKLVGDANSHGIPFVKETSIYSRPQWNSTKTQQYGTIYGTTIGGGKVESEEPDGFGAMIMEFLCWIVFWLAEQLDGILSNGGIALDNVIFGRVAGYGVKLNGSSNYITMFGFELTNDNPYGYVAAILFQRIRSYIYIFMALYCLYKLIRIACKGDYDQMRMDAKVFAGNVVLAFGAIVMMPYILDLFLYVRDVLLKGITFATLDDMFGANGFLEAFRNAAAAEKTNLIVDLIYLGAVVLSLFIAGIYVAYAMTMMVHFIFFPAVCLRGLSDNRAYGEWAGETLSLTIMPIVDGMILLIPLSFIKMANGNLALNILSLIACGLLLVVRKQVKRTLKLQDNSSLDNGAIATVMGLGMAAKGLANVGKKAIGKFAGGAKQAGALWQSAKEDSQQAKIHDMEADIPEKDGLSAPINASMGVDASTGLSGHTRSDVASAKADMLRKRATQKRWKAAAKVAGGTLGAAGAVGGGVTGATIGAGLGAFAGPSMQAAALGGMASAGATIGGGVGDLAGQPLGYVGGAAASGLGHVIGAGAAKVGKVVAGKHGGLRSSHRDATFAEVYSGILNKGTQFDAAGQEIWDQFAEYNAGEERAGDVDSTDLPAFGNASKGTGVGKSNVIDNKSLEIFFRKNEGRNAKDYCSAAASAVQRMEEQPGSLMRDDSFNEKISSVREQINSLVSRAQNGEDKESLLHGAGGLDEMHRSFETAKCDKLAYDMSVNLNLMGAEYSPQSMLHRGALNSVVNHMATVTEENNAPMLQQSGRYMTDEYDKNFNIFWNEAEKMINASGLIKK